MNKQEIEKLLEGFKDKPFNSHGFGHEIYSVLKPELEAAGIKRSFSDAGYLTYDTDHQTMKLIYYVNGNKYSVGAIKVKKAKGSSHYNAFFGGSYCDWTISGFDVEIYGTDGTIETRIKELEAAATQYRKNKENRQAELVDVVKLIMKETGKSYREIMNYAGEINNFRYSDDFENKCLQNN